MNYLAHAYLSFGHPGILAGNMISDFVKGRQKLNFPLVIQQGIELHRQIDRYTDTHPATREAKTVFQKAYRLYSGAMVDVIYDHFLANDKSAFSEGSLFSFSQTTYEQLDRQTGWMPERFARMYPYMKEQNWLFNYQSRWGTKNSLGGLVRRAAYLDEHETAYQIFETHYQLLEDCYRLFWTDMHPFAREVFDSLSETGDTV